MKCDRHNWIEDPDELLEWPMLHVKGEIFAKYKNQRAKKCSNCDVKKS